MPVSSPVRASFANQYRGSWAYRQVGAPYGVPVLGRGRPTLSPDRRGVALRPTGAAVWVLNVLVAILVVVLGVVVVGVLLCLALGERD